MLTYNDIAKEFYPLKWVQQKLIFNSVLGMEKLTSTPLCLSTESLELEYDRMDCLNNLLNNSKGFEFHNKIAHILGTFRNIKGAFDHIEKEITLSELELFEIKYFTYNYLYFIRFLEEYNLQIYKTEDLSPVFQLLDPDKTGVVSFYIYDSYNRELAELRKKVKIGDTSEDLFEKIDSVSYVVRKELTRSLKPFANKLKFGLDSIACWDLLIAKVLFAKENIFCRPLFCEYGNTSFKGLLNPYLSYTITSRNENYQPIDISLTHGPTLITGANMSGKTMVLKSIALAQYLIQFGFYAPARIAHVALVEQVMFLIGDNQNEDKGLSSFGAEILAISNIIDIISQGRKPLVLLDEPARTTSPDEGIKIVNAVIELLSEEQIMSLVTTHYNRLKTDCRCLRVKGFVEELVHENINCKNINRFIDYQLVEVKINEGSSEAITVARLLKVSDRLLNKINS